MFVDRERQLATFMRWSEEGADRYLEAQAVLEWFYVAPDEQKRQWLASVWQIWMRRAEYCYLMARRASFNPQLFEYYE